MRVKDISDEKKHERADSSFYKSRIVTFEDVYGNECGMMFCGYSLCYIPMLSLNTVCTACITLAGLRHFWGHCDGKHEQELWTSSRLSEDLPIPCGDGRLCEC